jgi:hypothetical protein
MVALLVALPALAGDDLQERPPSSFVTLAPVGPVQIPVGGGTPLQLTFVVGSGLHINSHKPNSDLQIPTTLKLNLPTDLGVGRVEFPAGQDLTFSFAPDVKLSVYSGEFAVKARMSAVRTAATGNFTVHGTLHYQACDDKLCYPPKDLDFAFNVKVVRVSRRR